MSAQPTSSRVRELAPSDLPRILDLQRAILAGVPEGYVRPRTERDLTCIVDGTLGAAFGIPEGADLAAAALLMLPSAAEAGASFDGDIAKHGVVVANGFRERIAPRDWSAATCFLGNAMVRPESRGRGYQRDLIAARLVHAEAIGMRWVFSGAHAANAVSCRNLLAEGMAVAFVRRVSGSPILGFVSGLSAAAIRSNPGDRIVVGGLDPVRHSAALERGYVGRSMAADGAIVYERLLADRVRVAALTPGASSDRSGDRLR